MKSNLLRKITAIVIMYIFIFTSLSSALANTFRAARIIDFSGSVSIYKAGGEKEFPAFKGMSLSEGDSIFTGANSWAELQLDDDKAVKLGDNTQMAMSELRGSVESEDDRTGLSLWVGKVWTSIKKKLNINSKYEIKTPTTVMGVRGTKFFVSEGRDNTYITVVEGRLFAVKTVTAQNQESNIEERQLEMFLEANQQVTLDDLVQYHEDIVVEPVVLEALDLIVLEEIKKDPEGIDPELIENIDKVIENKRQQLPPEVLQAKPVKKDINYVPSDGTSDDDDNNNNNTTHVITLSSIDNISIESGDYIDINLESTPSDSQKTAVSSNGQIAGVSISGNIMTVSGISEGTATITVTASKTGYTQAVRQFSVSVTTSGVIPQFIEIPSVEANESSANISVQTNTDGRVFYIVLQNEDVNEYAPETAEEIVNFDPHAVDGLSSWSGNFDVYTDETRSVNIQDLIDNETYVAYIVLTDFSGNLSDISEVPFSTEDHASISIVYPSGTVIPEFDNVSGGVKLSLFGYVTDTEGDIENVKISIMDSSGNYLTDNLSGTFSSTEEIQLLANISSGEWRLVVTMNEIPDGDYTAKVTPYDSEAGSQITVNFTVQNDEQGEGYIKNIDTFYYNGDLIFNISFDTAITANIKFKYNGTDIKTSVINNTSGELLDWTTTVNLDNAPDDYPYDDGYSYNITLQDESGIEIGVLNDNIKSFDKCNISFSQYGDIYVEGKAFMVDTVKITVEDSNSSIVYPSIPQWINVDDTNIYNITLQDPRNYISVNGVYEIVLTLDDLDDDFGIVIGYIIKTNKGITLKERTW